jgi:hypothetical protein
VQGDRVLVKDGLIKCTQIRNPEGVGNQVLSHFRIIVAQNDDSESGKGPGYSVRRPGRSGSRIFPVYHMAIPRAQNESPFYHPPKVQHRVKPAAMPCRPAAKGAAGVLCGPTLAAYRMVQDEQHHGTDEGHEYAPDVESRDAGTADRPKDYATDKGTHNSQDDVEN